jgi:predicted ester cyclase
MKKLFLTTAGLLILNLFSIAQTDNGWNSNSSQKVFHAIETGDVSDVDGIIDQNIIDHTMQGDIHGLDSVKNMFMEMHNHIDNLKFQSLASATDGDYNLTLTRMTGTTNSAFMGMPANTPIDMTTVNVVRIENGKGVEHWDYMSPEQAQQMMHMSMMNGDHNMNMNHNMDHNMNNDMKSTDKHD